MISSKLFNTLSFKLFNNTLKTETFVTFDIRVFLNWHFGVSLEEAEEESPQETEDVFDSIEEETENCSTKR